MSTTKPKSPAARNADVDLRLNPHRFAQLFAATMETQLLKKGLKSLTAAAAERIRRILERNLERSLLSEALAGASARPATGRSAARLPAGDLPPAEVIERQLVSMTLSNLYRAAANGRFYFITSQGRANGRLFPAWQFVSPVPSVLPQALAQLQQHAESERHALLVSEADELNELSPAEVLAGRPFESRAVLEPSQVKLLSLPTLERLAIVKRVLERPAASQSVG